MDTKKLRQKILDLAIHGKLVPQDPNDEPASVLLERIRKEKEQLIKEGKIKAPKKSKTSSDMSHYPKEGPWKLPNGWVWSYLGEISDYGKCITVPVSAIKDDEWVLELEDIEKDTGRLAKQIAKRERSINGSRHAFSEDQVLFSKLRTYLNKGLVAPSNGYCTTEIIPISPQSGVLPEYLNLVLRSPYFLDYTAQCGYGVKMPRLGTSDAIKALIPIPPHEEQRRIVESVGIYSDIIELIQSEKERLAKYVSNCKSVILDLAIHGKLVPQDPNDEPAIELLKRINPDFKPSDNLHYEGEIPAGWFFSTLGELFKHNTGKALNAVNSKGEMLRYITTSNLYWDRFDLSETRIMPFTEAEKEKCRAIKGDLLVCEGGDIGRAAIWPYEESIMIQNHIHKLRPRAQVSVRFFYYVLNLYKHEGLIGGKGIGIQGLSSRELDKLIVPVPPIREQNEIVIRIDELLSFLDDIANSCIS